MKELVCPRCHKFIPIKRIYHSGFSNVGYLYCSKNSDTLIFSTFDEQYKKILKKHVHPWMLSAQEQNVIEKQLCKCPCGGLFRFKNFPQCPYCQSSIQKSIGPKMYYVVINQLVNGEKGQIWKTSLLPCAQTM